MSFVLRVFSIAAVASVPLISAFAPSEINSISRPLKTSMMTRTAGSTKLYLSAADEARELLAKAKKLREEAAAMSGKTFEEVQEEAQQAKQYEQERRRELDEKRKERSSNTRSQASSRVVPVPDDARAEIQQAASAVERAYKDGIVRQTVKFALLEPEEMMTGVENMWPGGTQQMYRESARPLTEALLREVRAVSTNEGTDDSSGTSQSNMPPTVTAEDVWDFDGSAIISAKAASGSKGDVTALVFPNTDTKYLKDIESLDKSVGPDRLLLLINPFWKDVESWGFNILAPNGKKRAQEVVFDNGYEITYAVNRFSVRGEDCVALKAYPFDWQMYAYREDPAWFNQEIAIYLGSSKEQPNLSQFSEKINALPEFKLSKNMRQMQRMMGNDDQ